MIVGVLTCAVTLMPVIVLVIAGTPHCTCVPATLLSGVFGAAVVVSAVPLDTDLIVVVCPLIVIVAPTWAALNCVAPLPQPVTLSAPLEPLTDQVTVQVTKFQYRSSR